MALTAERLADRVEEDVDQVDVLRHRHDRVLDRERVLERAVDEAAAVRGVTNTPRRRRRPWFCRTKNELVGKQDSCFEFCPLILYKQDLFAEGAGASRRESVPCSSG